MREGRGTERLIPTCEKLTFKYIFNASCNTLSNRAIRVYTEGMEMFVDVTIILYRSIAMTNNFKFL